MDIKKKFTPKQQRLIGIGLGVFFLLLFVSLLLSLVDGDEQQRIEVLEQPQSEGSLQLQQPQMPSSQRYDFNHDPASQGSGLEDLLNNDQELIVSNDPFASMQGGEGPAPTYGPAPLPTAEEEAAGTVTEELTMPEPQTNTTYSLFCDEFNSNQEAESQKAMLAFQGISTSIVEKNGKYRLKLGPYGNPENARNAFNDLGNKGLIKKCTLITN